MNKVLYFSVLVLSFLFVACEPTLDDAPDVGVAPTAEDLSFTITEGDDDFTFVMTNTSSVSGIVKWDFGNGTKGEGDVVNVKYPLPGDYTVTLTIYTKGGSATVTQQHGTTKTDYSIFSDPMYISLSGGLDNLEGKTWVIDSLTDGHFGIGPADGNAPIWWPAQPVQKTGSGAYDDEFVFTLNGLDFEFINNGDSYVKDYRKDLSFYSNPEELYGEVDCKVDYTPSPATWIITTKEDGDYLVLNSATPAFFGFDYGAKNGEFRIEDLTENTMHLSCIGGDDNRWFYKLIVKGYERPTVTFNLSAVASGDVNTFDVSLADVVIPEGNSISGVSYTFGDGATYTTTDYSEVISHQYMRKGSYKVTVSVETTAGTFDANTSVDVVAHHPDYTEFILDQMVIYSDFYEIELAPVLGENCGLATVDNPDAIYPNRSSKVAHYTKENQPWANAYMLLPAGFRFDLRLQSTFKIKVYGKAGDAVLLKLENTDRPEPWKTGVELTYTIQNDNTWEIVEYDFSGIASNGNGDIVASDVVTDDRFNHDYYNVVRIMLNAGNDKGFHEFYFDDLSGPHVEGVKSTRLN